MSDHSVLVEVKAAVDRAFADLKNCGIPECGIPEYWRHLDRRIWVNQHGELVIEDRHTRDETRMFNGGEYSYYECFRATEVGVLQFSDWSADFDREEFLRSDIMHWGDNTPIQTLYEYAVVYANSVVATYS